MSEDRDSTTASWNVPKEKPVMVAGEFEFVLMRADGGLDKAGISQIRAHTTRELHKSRRRKGEVRWTHLTARCKLAYILQISSLISIC